MPQKAKVTGPGIGTNLAFLESKWQEGSRRALESANLFIISLCSTTAVSGDALPVLMFMPVLPLGQQPGRSQASSTEANDTMCFCKIQV